MTTTNLVMMHAVKHESVIASEIQFSLDDGLVRELWIRLELADHEIPEVALAAILTNVLVDGLEELTINPSSLHWFFLITKIKFLPIFSAK